MLQFLTASAAAFDQLEQRARRSCVAYRDQELPSGCQPRRGRIGFEVRPDGTAILLIDRGVVYTGSDEEIRRWTSAGQIVFVDFQALRAWIQGPLAESFPRADLSPSDLTDVRAIVRDLSPIDAGVQVEESRLKAELSKRIRGQDESVAMLARAVSLHVARRCPRRPLTILALGPTGVGKTATAECLPASINRLLPAGPLYRYLRLDMSEYHESHRVSQLLGAPQGYVGYGEGAQLTDTLRSSERCVILFDEIEKAHPSIFLSLMNAMDAGRLSSPTSAGGHEIDCRKAIFFFTTNLTSQPVIDEILRRNAFGDRATVDEICRTQLNATGMPIELVGRVRSFLVFRPLSDSAQVEVLALAVRRVAEEYGVNVVRIAPSLVAELLTAYRTHQFGARPAEYAIDECLGPCFAAAASSEMNGAARWELVQGPPHACQPIILKSTD